MVMAGELVFDVGMHNGNDSAYYLDCGYRVVAVEANPVLCDDARSRFAPHVEAGRLRIRNVGVAETAGELEFWVSDRSEWSSFHRENATQQGTAATSITVPTVPFRDLLAEAEETPLYIKVDIERSDSLCIRDLPVDALPAYVSLESHVGADADIEFLAALGYCGFKCVRQNDLREITTRNVVAQGRARRLIATVAKVSGRADGRLQQLHYRRQAVNGYRFPDGTSGPLARDLPGPWITPSQMLEVWQTLIEIDSRLHANGIGEWFDIHAALDPT